MDISVNYLGNPRITVDGKKVITLQNKNFALLLYVLFNETCTRNELASMFWCDYPEESAKRNLRNSLYKIRESIGNDVLSVQGHTYIEVSPSIKLTRDVDLFIMDNTDEKLLNIGSYTFLEHVSVADSAEFENWVSSVRSAYEKMTLERLKAIMDQSIEQNAVEKAEKCSRKILDIDPYNEDACCILLGILAERREFKEAIGTYQRFASQLKNDIGILPGHELQSVYDKVLSGNMEDSEPAESAKFGRDYNKEISILKEQYGAFIGGNEYRNCILSGDLGSKKSAVITDFSAGLENVTIVRVRFQAADHHLSFYAIDRIIVELNSRLGLNSTQKEYGLSNSDLYYLYALNRVFLHVKQTNLKMVLILENLESVDNDSIDLITHYFFEVYSRDIFTIGEYSHQFSASNRLFMLLRMAPGVKLIETHPLTRIEASKFICDIDNLSTISDKIASEAMEYTGGNLMLLSDFADDFKKGEDDLLKIMPETRMEFEKVLASMTPKEITYIEFLSIMDRGAEFDMIQSVLGDTPLVALETIEKLVNRQLIIQVKTEERMLLFIPEKMIRNFMHKRMLDIKAVELHRLAAEYSERRYIENNTEYFYLTETKYHYSFTDNTYKKLHYNILFLETGLDYFDEFFPTVFSEEQKRLGMDVHKEEILRNITEYEADLLAMEGTIPYNQFYDLKCRLDFIHGRTLTRDGKREQGQKYIYDVVKLAKECGLDDILMKAYVETLCFALKTENVELMQEYVSLTEELANHERYEKENAVILRIEAYFAIRNHEFRKAEELLLKSLEIFSQPKLRRSNYFNIAACYDYLSDNSREQGKYEEALDYLNKAIGICLEKNERKSLDLFYEDYGYILFLQREYDEAYRYFEESIKLYEEFRTYWLRSIAESCLAMICCQRGQKEKAVEHFRLAEIFSKKDRSSEELRVLETARREMRKAKLI